MNPLDAVLDQANPPVVLTIAGTDSGGAAGIAADLTTFAAHGAHGACVVTATTAQDTTGVHDVHPIPVDHVAAQLDAVLTDLPVAAVKTGMLGSPEVVALVAERCHGIPLVVDPVLVATSGAVLGDESVAKAYLADLFPVATVATPNLDEARALLGRREDPASVLARRLSAWGPAVVVTGGGSEGTCTDWLSVPGEDLRPFSHHAVATNNDHGSGCTFSAALAARLAHGDSVADACERAAAYTVGQLRAGSRWTLGRGRGPVAHLFEAT